MEWNKTKQKKANPCQILLQIFLCIFGNLAVILYCNSFLYCCCDLDWQYDDFSRERWAITQSSKLNCYEYGGFWKNWDFYKLEMKSFNIKGMVCNIHSMFLPSRQINSCNEYIDILSMSSSPHCFYPPSFIKTMFSSGMTFYEIIAEFWVWQI